MDIFKDFRIPMPEMFESPSLTRIGKFHRGILTTALIIFSILQAINWRKQDNGETEFQCEVYGDGVAETKELGRYTSQRFIEYQQKYTLISLGLFVAFILVNLSIVSVYMSYVGERFKTWVALKTTKQRGKILAELKASTAVFRAYTLQLCVKLASTVIFILYNCVAYSVIAPSLTEYKKQWTSMPFVSDDSFEPVIHCHADQAFHSSMFNITLLTLAAFSGVLTFTELVYIWQETKAFKWTSNYYFCMFLLRHNSVTESSKAIIARELFLEKQKEIIETFETKRHAILLPLCPGRTLPFITGNIFLSHKKMKYHKQKHKQEPFRTYSRTKKIPLASLEDLFRSGKDALNPKTILVTGDAGTGKTDLVTTVIRHFNQGLFSVESEIQSLQFIFSFDLKELDSIKEHVALQELLEFSGTSSKLNDVVFEQIIANPEEVFLVFDGLNEWTARLSTNQTHLPQATNYCKASVASLVLSLLSRKLLPGCTILVTSRPTSLKADIEAVGVFDRYAELGSFEPDDVKAYVQKFFFDNKSLGFYLKQRLSNDEKLEALCRIPLHCYFLCIYLNFLSSRITLEMIEALDLPTTATKLLERLTEGTTASKTGPDHHKILSSDVESTSENFTKALQKLSHLAFIGMTQGRFVFGSEDLLFVELSTVEVEILEKTSLLRRLRPYSIEGMNCYCFGCLSVQEFLAAKRIVQTGDLKNFLEMADENHSSTLQFVAGLCKDEKKTKSVFVSLMQHLTRALKCVSEPVIENQAFVFLCKCIYENGTQLGHPFAREATSELSLCKGIAFTSVGTNPQTMAAILHCIKNAKGDSIKKVIFESTTIGNSGFRQVASFLCDVSCNLEQVQVTNSKISDDGMLAFLEITAKNSFLGVKILGLRGNQITSEGAKYLACVLFNDWCQLEELYLGNNLIGDLGVEHLSEALCDGKSKIQTLDLSSNGITHNGVFFLCKALSSPVGNIKRLYLQNNRILDFGLQDLCESLSSGTCSLKVLFASSNSITDDGIAFVEKALAHKSCGLQELYLGYNQVTDKGVKSLLQALPNHQFNLKVLSLANNPITDIGVKMLANALRNSSCNLHRIRISLTRSHPTTNTKTSKLQVRYVNA
ncbi:NACHT [Acropora cervicornis]|uniref:NACHT n=1 Tax=Acropora cervicornis TaxID=6130 RepID=A0AAD9QQB8_ACRCE|nr:NACHT [Acropora cervicornis]